MNIKLALTVIVLIQAAQCVSAERDVEILNRSKKAAHERGEQCSRALEKYAVSTVEAVRFASSALTRLMKKSKEDGDRKEDQQKDSMSTH